MPRNMLLTGVPGVGKTTVIRRVLDKTNVNAGGFLTEEIRENNDRVGFRIATLDGRTGILAHVKHKGPYRVGKYRVNINDLERVAAAAIRSALERNDLIVIDELGRMEVYSPLFQQVVMDALDSEKPVFGTIQVRHNSFLDSIRARDDVSLIQVTTHNRDALVETVHRELRSLMEEVTHHD